MPLGIAGAILGGAAISALGSVFGSKSQSKSTRKAIEAQNKLLGPFTDAGAAGLGAVQSFVDEGASVNFSDTQAFKDIINSQKARGQNLSGNTLTSLAEFNATNFRPQRLAELGFLPTLGANAAARQASNVGGLFQSQGAIKAGGIANLANIGSSTLSSLAFLNQFKGGGIT